MDSIIFYSVAEYADNANKLTIKRQDNQVRTEIWSSSKEEIFTKTKTYMTKSRAFKEYKIKIAEAILGGWIVLNAFPKRETWEMKRSK
jgi:hypothetical protein